MILINGLNPGMSLSLLVFTNTTKKPKGSVGSGHVFGWWTNSTKTYCYLQLSSSGQQRLKAKAQMNL